jgi:hypothetical protein
LRLPEIKPHVNGKPLAPPKTGGASVVSHPRTVFPSIRLRLSWPTLFYHASRAQWGGFRLIRLPQWLLLAVALLCILAPLPGRWWIATGCICLLVVLQWSLFRLQRRDFVTFRPAAMPAVQPEVLPASEKLPIFATGHFTVQDKNQRFTWLPGFYRTFATREHALLCQLAERPLAGVANWPETEVGLWYIFFMPEAIRELRWGKLAFGRTALPAIAVTYVPAEERADRRRSTGLRLETIYLAFTDEQTGRTILADLLHDSPEKAPASLTTQR